MYVMRYKDRPRRVSVEEDLQYMSHRGIVSRFRLVSCRENMIIQASGSCGNICFRHICVGSHSSLWASVNVRNCIHFFLWDDTFIVRDCMIDEKLKEARCSCKVNSLSCEHNDESCVNTLFNIAGKTKNVVFCKKLPWYGSSRHYSSSFI